MPEPYKRVVEYHFEVCGEVIAITDFGINTCGSETDLHGNHKVVTYQSHFVVVEEVRKNGQEDSHMSGCLSSDEDGVFSWAEGEDSFIKYHSRKLADAICKYLNTHGVPANA